MEATFLAKRALFNVTKVLPQGPPGYVQSTSRISKSCLSIAYERAEGSNAVAETTGAGNETSGTANDSTRQGMYETKQQGLDIDEGSGSGVVANIVVADTKKGVVDTAKKTMDGAWKAGKETTQLIRDTVVGDGDQIDEDMAVSEADKIDGPVATSEYRSICVEDLRKRSSGYNKAH